MRILHNKRFFALAVCVGLSNCKSTQQSETRSLENFAAGQTIKVNTCSNPQGGVNMIDQEVSALIDGLELIQAPENLEGDVSSAISAMPVNLLNMYFTTGNRIIVSNKAFDGMKDSGISDCKTARKKGQVLAQDFYNAPAGLDSCVVKESPESGTTRVSIYIEENSGAIHHNLIRRMSQVVSMYLSKLQSSSRGLSITDSVDGDFAGWQKDMVAAVNLDIEKLSNESAEGYLKAEGYFKTKKQLNDDQKFAEHVFAESMDSYFCSAESYESMEREFTNAFKSFKKLEAGLLALWMAEEAQSPLNLSRRRPIRRILGGAGRAAYNTSRGVGRAAIRVGRGAARVGKAVGPRVKQAGAFVGRAVVGTGKVILQGGRNVIRHTTRGIRNEIKFRRSTGYVFPRLRGYRRR